jgi:hypothetical protein
LCNQQQLQERFLFKVLLWLYEQSDRLCGVCQQSIRRLHGLRLAGGNACGEQHRGQLLSYAQHDEQFHHVSSAVAFIVLYARKKVARELCFNVVFS